MNEPLKDFDLLGRRVTDVVTGVTGVVTGISYDLYGCVQAIVTPGVDKNGEPMRERWFDTSRLTPTSQPVMPLPDFSPEGFKPHGAAFKPPRG